MKVLVAITLGRGGDDARDFADTLGKAIARWAERNRWKAEFVSKPATVNLEITGDSLPQPTWLAGVHRRVSQPAGKGRNGRRASNVRHTSWVTVAVITQNGDAGPQEIPPGDVRVDVFKSSGPGGQGVNTTDSAVRVTHLPTRVTASCQDERSQTENQARAMRDLRSKLAGRARAERGAAMAAERAGQSDGSVMFAHNLLRHQVQHVPSGQSWPSGVWYSGRFTAPEGASS